VPGTKMTLFLIYSGERVSLSAYSFFVRNKDKVHDTQRRSCLHQALKARCSNAMAGGKSRVGRNHTRTVQKQY
jgi:hypothetical protein